MYNSEVESASSVVVISVWEGLPWHDGVDAVLPFVEDLVEVAVANADLNNLDGDILGAAGAASELEGL